MRPPICELCGSRFDSSAGGGLVEFANYKPLPQGMTGHPTGLGWFCERHYKAAQDLAAYPSAEALKRLRRKYWMSLWLFRLVKR